MDNKHDVFISYSRHDTQVVNEFVDRLERESFSVWIDRDGIESGDAFKKIILQAIKSSAVVLFFSSQHSNQSDWTAKEIGVAVKYKKSVIPILLDDSNFNEEVEFDLINLDYIDYQDASVRGIMMDRLVKSLKAKIPTPMGQKKAEEARLKAEAAERERLERERQEAERKAKEEAEKRAKQEAERKAKEEAEKRAKEEAARKAKEAEERERKERERKERERQAEEERKKICRAVSDGLIFNVNGVEFKMIKVAGGTFWMGADNGIRTRTVVKKGFFRDKEEQVTYVDKNVRNYDADAESNEYPVHSVTLSTFYMGETEVTQALWKAVMGSEPTCYGGWEDQYGKGDNYPAYRVNYNEIVDEFLPRLNQLTGKNFRLPTEAEWEYAARGGKESRGYKYAGSNTINDVAWHPENNSSGTGPVKTKSPNELGLYDMSGNVWEWCNDWYGNYSSTVQTDPKGPSSGSTRVLRGGNWYLIARCYRVSNRDDSVPGGSSNLCGFRLCLPQ